MSAATAVAPPAAAPGLVERVHARLLSQPDLLDLADADAGHDQRPGSGADRLPVGDAAPAPTGAGGPTSALPRPLGAGAPGPRSDALRAGLARLVRAEAPLLGPRDVQHAVDALVARVRGLGPIEPLLADPGVTEVMVNGPGPVWIERAGALTATEVVLDAPTILLLIERVVAPLGLRIDRTSPLVDARLPDGSRVNAVVPPLAVDGPCLTIRRFGARAIPLEAMASPPVADLLSWAVRARCNVLVSGGTGSGKTTLLNALAAGIPPAERVVTVEDAAELRLGRSHVVRLEARPANAEGVGRIGVRDLVRNALRMRPDRIVVGEVRGPEALDMLQAMNTGHEGSLSTVHANSTLDALRRVVTMILMGDAALPLVAVCDQVAASVDLVVHVARGPGGTRRVVQVAEVVDPALDNPGPGTLRSAYGAVRLVADVDERVAGLHRAPRDPSAGAPPEPSRPRVVPRAGGHDAPAAATPGEGTSGPSAPPSPAGRGNPIPGNAGAGDSPVPGPWPREGRGPAAGNAPAGPVTDAAGSPTTRSGTAPGSVTP